MSGLAARIGASLVSRAWSALVQLALVPLYIRFLGVEAYGVVGAFVALQTLLSLFDLGLGATLTREIARNSTLGRAAEMRDLLRSLEFLYWLIALLIAAAISALAGLIANHWLNPGALPRPAIASAIRIAGVAFALQWPSVLYDAGLTGLQRQISLSWIVAVTGTLRPLIITAGLWAIAPTLQVFFIMQAAINAPRTLVAATTLWRGMPAVRGRASPSLALIRGILPFATGMIGITITSLALTQLDKAVLSKTLPLKEFGYYAVASTLASGIYVLVSPMFAVFFPRFSMLVAKEDHAAVSELYSASSQLISVIVLPVAAFFMIFAPVVLRLWTRNADIVEHAAGLLSLLAVGNALNGLANIPYALQLAHGWTSLAFYANVAAIIVCAPLTYLLSLRLGATGGAIVWVLLTVFYLLVTVPLCHRRLLPGRLRHWYTIDVGVPALCSFAVMFCAKALLPLPTSPVRAMLVLLCVLFVTWSVSALLAPAIRAAVFLRFSSACRSRRIHLS